MSMLKWIVGITIFVMLGLVVIKVVLLNNHNKSVASGTLLDAVARNVAFYYSTSNKLPRKIEELGGELRDNYEIRILETNVFRLITKGKLHRLERSYSIEGTNLFSF